MKPRDCTTKSKKYVHLSEKERYKIEGLLEGKKDVEEIAVILGRHQSTIYREIIRGTIIRVLSNLSEKEKYRANAGWTPVLAPGTLLPFSMNSAGAGLSLKYFSTAYGTLYQFELIGGDANTIVNIDILSR